MDFLKAEIANKRKADTSPEPSGSGSPPPAANKYVRRGELERQREEQAKEERERRKHEREALQRVREEEKSRKVSQQPIDPGVEGVE